VPAIALNVARDNQDEELFVGQVIVPESSSATTQVKAAQEPQ
jgi:hypothetical protein